MDTPPVLTQFQTLSDRVQNALRRTSAWIERFGPRLAGTPGCRQTAAALHAELEHACGAARLETFSAHTSAFACFYQVDAVIYLVGLGLLLLNLPLPAALLLTAMVVAAGLQFGYYWELYDRLYPLAECTNVTAVLEPQGEVTQQVIFSGHHDAALELKFLKGSQKLYVLKIIVPDFFRIMAAVVGWAWLAGQALGGSQPGFVLPAKVLLVAGIYFVFTKFHLFTQNVTPGAGDNLIASAMLVELAGHFSDPNSPGRSILEHTRLLFASFDAEESGLRGSRAWVRAHNAELRALPTAALNIDSIYNLQELQFLVSDLNSHVHLDRALVQRCIETAHGLGYPAAPAVMRFGGGATDAAELARAGVRATTMIAMSSKVVRDGLVYHTMQDTVDQIEPGAVLACLAVAEQLARRLDQEKSEKKLSNQAGIR